MHTFVVVKKVPGAGLGGNANLELLRNLFGGLGAGGFDAPANQSNGKCFLILSLSLESTLYQQRLVG